MQEEPLTPRSLARTRRASAHWAGQFLVAGELERRGYVVSFTMGNNTPVADLMVGHPNGEQFWVDVKAQWTNSAWWASKQAPRMNLFYVLVLVGPDRHRDRFFVLDQTELNGLIDRYLEAHPSSRNFSGFDWGDALEHEDRWDKLPGST